MGELIQLRNNKTGNSIRQVRTGVFLLDQPPQDTLLQTENYFTATHFGVAGEQAGKTSNYGQGVMRDIALQMVTIEGENVFSVNGFDGYVMRGTPEYDLHQEISQLMNNPDKIKNGSRDLLLLGRQLVHDVWATGLGSEVVKADKVPVLGKVGHRIVSQLFVVK